MAKVDFVKIDEARFVEVCRLYFIWKDLNNSIKLLGGLMSR
ncbi:hypothetical protein CHL14416_08820 [Campylobacter hyointestinalis subsp. lawsonii]|uniref:Bsp6I family restriction endonuclease n=1 Tax=Campylobacter hyointestinalis subsp. lawsonii TaxID=91353 RepID=A0AAV6EGD1_CAMHY|nr:Bsp6I family restriction endonuclease [Campylobacter hyointestinalis subsp. lawsonii]RAZ22842.1 hypothetical protein CHL9752_08465 [Campylobacter hyointestinalis subsp. lawsonii]RAZ27372.1 hypothetical protein CHLT_08140 [Campylobacter hyointestinalis subsp. lawsonii]RAZ45139.1 hypothetical protein CHL14416_08820 [Campylobacter hyointestinalis subsp. lawsonii]